MCVWEPLGHEEFALSHANKATEQRWKGMNECIRAFLYLPKKMAL